MGTTHKPMNLIAYARTNTNRPKGTFNGSITKQFNLIKKWANEKGHQISIYCCDRVISGIHPNPPKLTNLIKDITNDEILVNAIVVTQSNRLTRDMFTGALIRKRLNKKNVSIISLESDNEQNLVYDFKEISKSIKSLVCNISDKQKKSPNTEVNVFKENPKGEIAPFGFETYSTNHNKQELVTSREFLINRYEVNTIRKIFLMTNITPSLAFTPQEIAKFLNEKKEFKRGRQWTKKLILSVLTNSIYCGIRHIGSDAITPHEYNSLIKTSSTEIISKKAFLKTQCILNNSDGVNNNET